MGIWLHPRRARRLAASLPPEMLLVEARVAMAERLPPFEALVVDPLAGDSLGVDAVLEICARWRNVPTLVYTSLDLGVATALLTLGRAGLCRVAIERLDDGPAALREAFTALARESVLERGLDLVTRAIGGLPLDVRGMIVGVLRQPAAMQSVDELARQGDLHRRSLERRLRRDSLPCAADLLALGRVAMAYLHLHQTAAPVADAARLLGYATQRTMTDHAKLCAGMSLGELRSRTPMEFIAAVRSTRLRHRVGRAAVQQPRRAVPATVGLTGTMLYELHEPYATSPIGCRDE